MHIPLNFGTVIKRNMEKIEKSHAKVVDNIILSDENSLWGSDLYFLVDQEVVDAENVKLSGNYLTKVYEGPYKDAWKWAKDMENLVSSKGKKFNRIYHWYTTCPKCAKVYGKNYTVLFAEVEV